VLFEVIRDIFAFPNPVNETSARIVPGSGAALAVLTISFQQGPLIAVLAYGFLARSLAGPTFSPLALLATRVVTPRLAVKHRYSPGPAKRFAQAIGAVLTLAASLLYYAAGAREEAFALLGLLAVFASLEAALGLCVGCRLFYLGCGSGSSGRPSARTARGCSPSTWRSLCGMLPLEAVPNFSEGRDRATIDAIGAAIGSHAELLDVHSDEDHNRSVFTLAADAEPLVEALLAGIAVARDRIDLRLHAGAHPRIGVADVVPIVPVRQEDAERARTAARVLARRIAAELGLPVFLYADLAPGRGPAFFRRGGPEELQRRIDSGELTPDFGPHALDPSAGGVIVGSRSPLIAFNVDLSGDDLEAAQEIAAVVRERGGGFPGVRALGLRLSRAGRIQVSLNVEDWEAAPLHDVVAAIEREARARGLEVLGSELVGLMPAGAAVAAAGSLLRIPGFDASRVLELRLLDR